MFLEFAQNRWRKTNGTAQLFAQTTGFELYDHHRRKHSVEVDETNSSSKDEILYITTVSTTLEGTNIYPTWENGTLSSHVPAFSGTCQFPGGQWILSLIGFKNSKNLATCLTIWIFLLFCSFFGRLEFPCRISVGLEVPMVFCWTTLRRAFNASKGQFQKLAERWEQRLQRMKDVRKVDVWCCVGCSCINGANGIPIWNGF